MHKVLSILVSYFDMEIGESVFQILISDLSDNTNYMSVKRRRLEKLLQSKPQQLLDIDCDICYCNIAKQFGKPTSQMLCWKMDWWHSLGHKVQFWYFGFAWRGLFYIEWIVYKNSSESKPSLVVCFWLLFYWYDFDRSTYLVILHIYIPNNLCETWEGDIKTIFDKYELNAKAKTIMLFRQKWSRRN